MTEIFFRWVFFLGGFVLGSLNDARLVGRFVGSRC